MRAAYRKSAMRKYRRTRFTIGKLSTHWNKPSWSRKPGFGLGMYNRKNYRR